MTYAQWVEVLNMPSILVIVFCVVYLGGLGIIWLWQKAHGKGMWE